MRGGFPTLSVMAIDIRQQQYTTDGFYRIESFVDPSVGQAMLADVVGLVRANDRGEPVDALVLPEAQPDFSRPAGGDGLAHGRANPEDVIAKVFKLHRRPAFA